MYVYNYMIMLRCKRGAKFTVNIINHLKLTDMKTIFGKVSNEKEFTIYYGNGRSIRYRKHINKNTGSNAIIIALDYYTNQADRNSIGNSVRILEYQLVSI